MKPFLTPATLLSVLLAAAACATAAEPMSAPRTAPPVVFGMGYTWGQTTDPYGGVRVRVHRPMLRAVSSTSPVPSSAWLSATRELVVKIDVFNSSRGAVRIGVAGYVGNYEAAPKVEEQPPTVAADSTGTIHRTVFVPAGNGPAVVHVAATVDGRALANGWRYVGPVDP